MMKNKILIKILILTIIFNFQIIFSSFIYANTISDGNNGFSFEMIDRDTGLSNLSVSSIIQDKYGFIWLGTQSGLNRYDGRKMKVIKNNPFREDGLVHNLIQTMYYDEKNHEIWIGTYQGVSRYDIENNEFINYTQEENGLSNSVIVAITKDLNEDIWMGTLDGLNKLNVETGMIKKYEISQKTVRTLLVDSKGRLLIGTYDGLFYYNENIDEIEKIEADLPSKYVMIVKEYDKGILTIGTWGGGICELNLETNEIKTITYETNEIYSLLKTKDNSLWVGTWGGGLFIEQENNEKIHYSGDGKDDSLAHPIVYSLFQDDSEIIWIGTNGGGLFKVNPEKENYIKLAYDAENPDSLSQGKINYIFHDSKEKFWFALYNNGLNYYDPEKNKIKKYINDPEDVDSLPSNQVIDIVELENEKLLLATDNGLVYFDMKTEKFSLWDILPSDMLIYKICKINENEFWIGTYHDGIFYYNGVTNELKQYSYKNDNNDLLSDNLIYSILYDSKKRLWVGTNNGLNLLEENSNEFKMYYRVDSDYTNLASNTIREIFEDSNDNIWIATVGGGLSLYEEKTDTFKTFTEDEGLSSNICMGILENNDGKIYVSTHDGISIINKDTFEISVLTPDDGIGGWEFNSGHVSVHGDELIFGGIHGIAVISTNEKKENIKKPQIYITDIQLFQKSIDENKMFFNDENLEFSYDESFLSFEFVALDYASPGKIMFSYKLEGFSDEWINSGVRDYVSYSNLPPGDYKFKVIAETSKNIKSDEVEVLITIKKPWFKNNISYSIYGLLIFLVIIGIDKIRKGKNIKIKNLELANINEKLEELATKDKLTGLFNRRYFDMLLENQLQLAIRSSVCLSLVMFDIDDFKDINDSFGHVAGDYYLSDISKEILDELPRSTDFIARYGGDEFVVVLYDTEKEGALLIANKINQMVKNVNIRDEFSKEKINRTISMGIVNIIPNKNITSEKIIQLADEALYKAKREGKNCISISETK